jgi:hypothetical protein
MTVFKYSTKKVTQWKNKHNKHFKFMTKFYKNAKTKNHKFRYHRHFRKIKKEYFLINLLCTMLRMMCNFKHQGRSMIFLPTVMTIRNLKGNKC